MLRLIVVRELKSLDLRRVETAVGAAAQAMFVKKDANDLVVSSGFCVRGTLGLDADR